MPKNVRIRVSLSESCYGATKHRTLTSRSPDAVAQPACSGVQGDFHFAVDAPALDSVV